MKDLLGFSLLTFSSLLAMVDPLGLVPIFLSTTSSYSEEHRKTTVRRAIFTGFLILMVFAILGLWIFRFFSITPGAFRIAGGVVLFGIGYDMLQVRKSRAKTTREEEEASSEKEDIGIVPLGVPLIAGPGAITSVIAASSRAKSFAEQMILVATIVAVLLITWAVLKAAPWIGKRVGPNGMNLVERIMALLVMVIGVQFIIDGIEASIFVLLQKIPH